MGGFQSTVWKVNSKKSAPSYVLPLCNTILDENDRGLSDYTQIKFYDMWNRGPFYSAAVSINLFMSNSSDNTGQNFGPLYGRTDFDSSNFGGVLFSSATYMYYLQDFANNYNTSVSDFTFTNYGSPLTIYTDDEESRDYYSLTSVTINTGETYHLRVPELYIEKPTEIFQLFDIIDGATVSKQVLSRIPSEAYADDACRALRVPTMQDPNIQAKKFAILDNDSDVSTIFFCVLLLLILLVSFPLLAPLAFIPIAMTGLADESAGIWDGSVLLDETLLPTMRSSLPPALPECEYDGITNHEFESGGLHWELVCLSSGTTLPFHYHDEFVNTTALTEGLQYTLDNKTWLPWELNRTFSVPAKMKHGVRATSNSQLISSSKESIVLGAHFF